MRLPARFLLAPLGLALLAAVPASAAAPSFTPRVEVSQQIFDLQGNPQLVANFAPDGSLATPSWAVCPPGEGPCTPTGVTRQVLEPGPTAMGTTFEASATYGGTTYTARSDPWLGTVAATAAPTLSGAARVGARVTPHAGSWTGGWGDERDVLHVEACRTRDGRDCTTVAHPWALRRAPPIDPRWSGRWLFAFDVRTAREIAVADVGYAVPFAIAPTPVGATVSRSAPLGPVRGPALRLRAHPLLRRDDRLLVGRATCAHGCRVSVGVRAGKVVRRARLRVHGTRDLAVPDAAGLPLEDGVSVRVRIGRAPLVHADVARHQVVAARCGAAGRCGGA